MLRFADSGLRAGAMLAGLIAGMMTTAAAGEPLEGLLRRIPASANVITVIDVKGLYSSPIGMKEGWKDRRQIFLDESVLPKNLSMIVVGAGVDVHELGKSWNLALVDLDRTVKTEEIVKAERGTLDVVGGRETVWTPRDAFYTVLTPSLLARYSPANRQEFSRWLSHEKQAPISTISPFLRRASNTIGRSGQMVVAIELKDVFLPAAISAYLKTSKALSSGMDQAKIAKILASIEGLTLSVSAEDDVNGVLRVEFTESPAPLGAAAKPLLLEVLSMIGAELVDLPSWDATTAGTEIVLKGKLTQGSMGRIMSLFDLPSESDLAESPDAETPKSPQSQAQATVKYYRSMQTLLNDLKKEKATGQKGASLWYERYARKIDQLPVLDVDSDMIGFGQWISDSLRGVSTSYYGVSAATGYRKSMTGGTGYGYGGYYTTGGGDKEAGDRIRRQENIFADKVYRDTWDQIDSKMASLRKEMTQKYRIEF